MKKLSDRRRFLGRTHFCTSNLGIWQFFRQETYIHLIAQETRISSKKVEMDNAKVVFLLELVVFINESWDIFLIMEHWSPISTFFMKKINNFLTVLVSCITLPDRKITIQKWVRPKKRRHRDTGCFQHCWRNVFRHKRIGSILLGIVFLCFCLGYTFYNAFGKGKAQKENLIGIGGLLFYIFVSLLCSVAPHRVREKFENSKAKFYNISILDKI